MRRENQPVSLQYRILVVNNDPGIIKSIMFLLRHSGYEITGLADPLRAVEELKSSHYDLLILDYVMHPLNGDLVVKKIREFDQELYILLLTSDQALAPPLETIRKLDIQGYYEKSDSLDQLQLLIESGIKAVRQLQAVKQLQDGLQWILQVVPRIFQLQPIDKLLHEILTGIMPLLDSENSFILLDNLLAGREGKSIFKGIGIYNSEAFISMLSPVLMENIGYARTSGKVVQFADGVIFPLVNNDRLTIGVIFVESRRYKGGTELLETYAYQAATAINNAFLHSLLYSKNEELNKTYDELRVRYMDTIHALRLTVDAKDFYTRGHSDRVAFFAVKIGEALKLAEDELEALRLGSVFHDIGKIGTADDILLKDSVLSDEEYNEIKKHPLKGAHILSAVSMFHAAVPLIRSHHERVDGKGYPDQLKDSEIPFLAKILSIADAFDAMTTDRQYRTKLELDEAIGQLVAGAGTQFDAGIVRTFVGLLNQPGFLDNIER